MTRRIVEVGLHGARVSTARRQIVIQRAEEVQPRELRVPAEDLGALILDNQQCVTTVPALARIADQGGIVVICGDKHLPVSVLLPVSCHTTTVVRIREQIEAPRPLVKRLWKQIVQAKIRAQARNLPPESAVREKLLALARGVRSGDAGNHEAQAARAYWPHWAADLPGFKRDTDGEGVNALLNYGYAIVRAATARALVAAGFCAAIGLHHRNRGNPFCLADDMMEPLRPLVDHRVRLIADNGDAEIGPETKSRLLGLLLDPVLHDGQLLPLMDTVQRTAASLARCLSKEQDQLEFPQGVEE